MATAYQRDTDLEAFKKSLEDLGVTKVTYTFSPLWIVETPNESVIDMNSPLPAFYITYWNDQQVLFSVPDEVWAAAISAYQKHPWCDPVLSVSTAHSESSIFNNNVCSSAGACGTWQFMPETWKGIWKQAKVSPIPDRTDRFAAAEAFCFYARDNGMISAIKSGDEEQFVFEFAEDPPVWNMYPPQAHYVWDLYHRINGESGNEMVGIVVGSYLRVGKQNLYQKIVWKLYLHFGLVDKDWLKKPITSLFATENTPPIIIEPAEGDEWVILPSSGVLTQGLHGQFYGHCAIDLSGGNQASVYSPINGTVTALFTDVFGNPVLRIENSIYKVQLLHGDWTVNIGDRLEIGQFVGYESNQGYTFGYNGNYCGTGSDCGYHVHFDISQKGGQCIDPLSLVNYP